MRATKEVEQQEERELGRAAMRTRGAPAWLVPALVLVLAFLVFWGYFRPIPGWPGWVILGGIILVVIGLAIAINPRRQSAAGGTRRR